jgi:Flp pilus assembly pilin Flp
MSHVYPNLADQKGTIMLYFIHRFLSRNQVGASGVEYALLIGLATLAIILGTVGLTGNVQAMYQAVTDGFAN